MIYAKRSFNDANEQHDFDAGSKADRAMPMESSTGKPLKERRVPSRDFGYEGANTMFRR